MITQEPVTMTTQDGVEIEAVHHFDDAVPSKTAITIMHPTTDLRQHVMLKWLAERGLGAFGYATRYTAREAELMLEDTLLDMAAGIEFLKSKGYEKVLGIGNSGGAEIIAAYQSEAVKPTIKSTPAGDPPDLTKAELPPYDGLIFLNPHIGRPISITRGLDPSVGGEDGNDPLAYDPSLDMYNPKNGPPYSQDFRGRYGAAQIERNDKITRWCRKKIEELKRTENPNLMDFPFIVHRCFADLHYVDQELDPSQRVAGQTIWEEDSKYSNYSPGPLRGLRTRMRIMTMRSWLSQRSLSTSHFNVLDHVGNCKVPTLMICGTAEESSPKHAMEILEKVPDPDKKLIWIKGGTHFMRGQEKQQNETADQIAAWLRERDLF